MLKVTVALAVTGLAVADFRYASQPRNKWEVKSRNRNARFVPEHALYMEPSDFNYRGLQKQRDGGGYDNFLRSNIDNEQDKRNFYREAGRDHLPFRSYETDFLDTHKSVKNKICDSTHSSFNAADGTCMRRNSKYPAEAITVAPGVPTIAPFRWNNPHASELEVNIWIMQEAGTPFCDKPTFSTDDGCSPIVVPIRRPACSGEGYQNNVITYTVPSDFNQLGSKIPGFKGCTEVGQCILQIYAHSVESRMYSNGVPLIVTGFDTEQVAAAQRATAYDVLPVPTEVGVNLALLDDQAGVPSPSGGAVCRPSNDPSVNIPTSVPQLPRLMSDQYNHAYQNSDYSPYAGQQPRLISRNVQAAAILKMVVGNRGELGKRKLYQDNRAAYFYAKRKDQKARNLIQLYEGLTNQIIRRIQRTVYSTDTSLEPLGQKTETCFRCAEVGSVNTRRLTTNTYVPSFHIPDAGALAVARQFLSSRRDHLIDENGNLRIYEAVLTDMTQDFLRASSKYGLNYLGAVTKTTLTTKADVAEFKKYNAAGRGDQGYFAATEAATVAGLFHEPFVAAGSLPAAMEVGGADDVDDDDDGDGIVASLGFDMNGVGKDNVLCDDDATTTDECDGMPAGYGVQESYQLFRDSASGFDQEDEFDNEANSAASVGVSWLAISGIICAAVALV